MALDTVQDYLDEARVLLQDTVAPFRYADEILVKGMDLAISEMVRVRPDLYFKNLRDNSVPTYSGQPTTSAVAIDIRYQMPALWYLTGYAQLSDEEDVQDARATALMQKFTAALVAGG